jgi:hypothetical protein
MAIDEVLTRLRRELEETYGREGAAYLMDRPQGGWASLATKDDLAAFATKDDLGVLKLELREELHREIRDQTRWFATAVIAAMSVSVMATAVIGAALRFA